ncbi:MAG: sulfatase-like hydrolase/transferase [Promethearchaeota archaeon]|jgi:hypothetical protein
MLKFFSKVKTVESLKEFFYYKIISVISKTKKEGFSIFTEKWDNLIILDDCRYDFFRHLLPSIEIDGFLEKKISRGSHTVQFLKENFKKKKYNDIVYLTANPIVNQLLHESFYRIISVWDEGWDKKYHTVLPEVMYEYALNAIKKYPNKKLIIHFMQPHFPSVRYDLRKGLVNKEQKTNLLKLYHGEIWKKYLLNTLIKGYLKSLKEVLLYVNKLINLLDGTIIITSDHGEAFGDRIHPLFPVKFYGHRINVKIPALLEIPWYVIESKIHRIDEKNKTELEKEILKMKIKDLNF